jgi:hypothetical protein
MMGIDRLATAVATIILAIAIGLGPDVPRAACGADAPNRKPPTLPAPPKVASEAGTAKVLERTIPEVRFDGVDLADVIEFLRDVSGLNIVVDWKRLEPAGATRNKPVSESEKETKVADLLTRIINKAADPKHPVKWSNAGGVVIVSTPAGLEAYEAAGKDVAPDKLDARSRTLLDRPLPEVKFDAVGLGDVIEFMKDVNGAPINVDWKALETAGVDRNAKVNVRVYGVPFGQAMRLILLSVADQTPLHFSAKDGKVQITADAPKK